MLQIFGMQNEHTTKHWSKLRDSVRPRIVLHKTVVVSRLRVMRTET